MNSTIKEFTDLNAWKEGHKLVLDVYKVTSEFPPRETYSITDQMRRAASSIAANIAEGFGRHSYKEKVQFYDLTQGSLTELKNFMIILRDVNYLKPNQFEQLKAQADLAHKLLQGLITKSKTFINPKS